MSFADPEHYKNEMLKKSSGERLIFDAMVNHPVNPIGYHIAYEKINSGIVGAIKYVLHVQGTPGILFEPFYGVASKSVDIVFEEDCDWMVYRDLVLMLESYMDYYHDLDNKDCDMQKMWDEIGDLDIIENYDVISAYRRGGIHNGMDIVAQEYGAHVLHNLIFQNPLLKGAIHFVKYAKHDVRMEFYLKQNGWRVEIPDRVTVGYALSIGDSVNLVHVDDANHFHKEQYLRALRDEFCKVPDSFGDDSHDRFWDEYKNDISDFVESDDDTKSFIIFVQDKMYAVRLCANIVFNTRKITGVIFEEIIGHSGLDLFSEVVFCGKCINASDDYGYHLSRKEKIYSLTTHSYDTGHTIEDELSYHQALSFIYNSCVNWHVVQE